MFRTENGKPLLRIRLIRNESFHNLIVSQTLQSGEETSEPVDSTKCLSIWCLSIRLAFGCWLASTSMVTKQFSPKMNPMSVSYYETYKLKLASIFVSLLFTKLIRASIYRWISFRNPLGAPAQGTVREIFSANRLWSARNPLRFVVKVRFSFVRRKSFCDDPKELENRILAGNLMDSSAGMMIIIVTLGNRRWLDDDNFRLSTWLSWR